MSVSSARVLAAGEGRVGWLGGLGVRFMIPGVESRGGFALVEHPMQPHTLAAPLHRHSREDEYSYVLYGRIGALLGDEVVRGGPGDLIYKPRGQWHTFWNESDEKASLLEIISPAGLEKFFEEIIELSDAGKLGPETIMPVSQRYGLEMDPSSIPELCARYKLKLG